MQGDVMLGLIKFDGELNFMWLVEEVYSSLFSFSWRWLYHSLVLLRFKFRINLFDRTILGRLLQNVFRRFDKELIRFTLGFWLANGLMPGCSIWVAATRITIHQLNYIKRFVVLWLKKTF